ncbi:UDP-N-acetylmuramoyl-L-alanine--D-glutamate ligase [Campylobacter ureolyticus]|uniref:UDP-N-acetylmuramoylalanine--D-glutamate ligase n=1 Tax=Campylobacter ureolyticus TaxID=827 RepID=A0A9Q4KM74_9BACT|nr:UDP-N-acetylmuramoyl-L-alanine--D-glutamate ligase [Campylobacter ureolyticus]MCZ6160635.1 UDP-N-acetylmuramoyl-L-alanine--D-glutamate ligase [Campylobacter ureolyticus]MCZ6164369.1 UDP-N-acetylmuramoyl-L-alanine--D-glutamate ligase [Campylobacter ureolyticus]MCZ6166188.1 UDP-N-acetylmuramoyl-L-alanine--D-glutamate ligase [Campylobacter ureolyticus]MCZ6167942.1 UDP-N-acetylmuramoyl-L-alanine--D-glutamate ligase [Campylobacter ureolyticus]
MKKSLFGYGKTTKAIARNVKFNGGWDIYDDKFIEISKDNLGNNLLPVSEFDSLKSTLEIPSPGFPRNHELVKKAKNLISEYDYFKDTPPVKIWISGTNGKTTTTQMAGLVLKKSGAAIGGNVGEPLANLDKLAKFWILETSSFTIYYTKFAAPQIYALLPITPDHISWHGSFEEYEKTKLKPLSMMGKGSVAIIPKKYDGIKSKAKIYFYKDESDLAKICGANLKDIKFKVPFLMDALLALCIEKFATNSLNLDLLNTFKIDKNRVEEFKDSKNRLWVNDTKATNLDAVIQALKRYRDKKIHLILGGDDKGVDLTPLFENFKGYNLEIYAIGSNTLKILNLALKFKIKAHKCDFLQDAVKNIDINLKNDEVALLSPACASLDQFSSYEERGNLFKKFVQEL